MHKYTRSSTLRDRHKEPAHVLVGQESSDFEMLSQLRVPQCMWFFHIKLELIITPTCVILADLSGSNQFSAQKLLRISVDQCYGFGVL